MSHATTHPAYPSNLPAGIHGVLGVLEEMAAEAGPPTSTVPEHFSWIPLPVANGLGDRDDGLPQRAVVGREETTRFGAIDAIRPQTRSLRVGLGFVAGTVSDEGTTRRIFEPLLTMPVVAGDGMVERAGDIELTPLVTDRHERLRLEAGLVWGGDELEGRGHYATPETLGDEGGLLHYLRDVARSAGIDVARRVAQPAKAPATLRQLEGAHLILGLGLYAIGTRPEFSPAAALAEWQRAVGTTWTALHTLYLDQPPPPWSGAAHNLPSAYELTEAQHAALVATRTEPLTLIAGAPGTGKTHTIAAIVGDAVAHGRSVLVATKAEPAVEAITELLDRRPGPEPVVFGSSHRRIALARRLAAGQPQPVPSAEVAARHQVMRDAQATRDARWQTTAAALAGIALLGDSPEGRALRHRLRGLATADVFAARRLIEAVGTARPGWWRVGARKRWEELIGLLDPAGEPAPEDLRAVVALAGALQGLHAAADPLDDGLDWRGLSEAQDDVERRAGEWMDGIGRDEARLDRQTRGTLGALANALRAGRGKRRATLASLTGQRLTRALPVWVGTLADIDDLLPLQPAMFDLVVLDEASSIDQPRAAAALLRGSRAVVVGDPQQLRHVSFVSTEATQKAIQAHVPTASAALRAKLDVRGSSIFDVAAAVAPVRTLDEHFRSAPHLFAFVGSRLYRDEVSLATRTPMTDREDRIHLVRLDARRRRDKVVAEEVDWVMDRLGQLRDEGVGSVGVVTPFRAMADAVEGRAVSRLGRARIDELGLRVGTVHAFQGMERDVILAPIGVGADDGAGTWRFVNDPHLFAVFATRARARMEVVLSAEPPAGSLLADYLAQVDHPPPPPDGIGAGVDPWTRSIAEGLVDAGVSVVSPYPAGRHLLDLVIHDGTRCLGVETRLHPDGPHAHARRHLELVEGGWRISTAHRATWAGRRAELVVALREALRLV